ncbi:MAG: hypothetical protein GY729_12030, partial [Desulfobacteraceae bacterium]|nr:hypothetical protein [Desulfobacteraceae bacterium]
FEKLLKDFEKRMRTSASSLKKLNKKKSDFELEIERFERRILHLSKTIQKKVDELLIDQFIFFEWARQQANIPKIQISQHAVQGTIFKGIFSSHTLGKKSKNFITFEKKISDEKNKYQMMMKKNI